MMMMMMMLSLPNSNSFGVFSHSKGFGAELFPDSPWFSGADPCWAAKGFCGRFYQGSTKVSRSLSYQGSTFLYQMTVVSEKVLFAGFRQSSLHLTPPLFLGSKLHELLTCLTHTPSICRKRPIMSLLLGYSLGI